MDMIMMILKDEMENQMDKATPREFLIQQGSLAYIIVEEDVAHWENRAFKVIEKTPEVAKAVELFDEMVELLCNITKEQSIPDFERSIAEAREYVNEQLAKAAK